MHRLSMPRITLSMLLVIALFMPQAGAQDEAEIKPFDHGFSFDFSLLNTLEYNRVEGTFPGGEITLKNNHLKGLSWINEAGYGLSSDEWRYRTTLEYAFDPFYYRSLSVSVYDIVNSNEKDLINNVENSLAAGLFHKDYRDFFRTKGAGGHFAYKYNENIRAAFSVDFRKFYSLEQNTDWSLFYQDRTFRSNPAVKEGDAHFASASFTVSTRQDFYVESNYWTLIARIEHEWKDFKFTGIHFQLDRTQLGRGRQTFAATLRGGMRPGTRAEQYLMDLGGIGTLRGYDYKEFTGNARIILNAEYQFNGDIMQKIPLQAIPFYSTLASGIFFDSGAAWILDGDRPGTILPEWTLVPHHETGSRLKDFKSSAGVSFYLLNRFFRIDIARRLDTSDNPWKTSIRLLWGADKLR